MDNYARPQGIIGKKINAKLCNVSVLNDEVVNAIEQCLYVEIFEITGEKTWIDEVVTKQYVATPIEWANYDLSEESCSTTGILNRLCGQFTGELVRSDMDKEPSYYYDVTIQRVDKIGAFNITSIVDRLPEYIERNTWINGDQRYLLISWDNVLSK